MASLFEKLFAKQHIAQNGKKEDIRLDAEHEVALQKHRAWIQPMHVEKFWQKDEFTAHYRAHFRKGGPTGKDNRYMATPTMRANSYTSVLEIYSKVKK